MTRLADVIETETWRVRQYRNEDKAGLLRLSALHYGDKEPSKEEYVDWLYGSTPAGPTIGIVVEDLPSKEIIGFNANVPFSTSFRGEADLCYLGCNMLVHPDYRRRGVFTSIHALANQVMEDSLFKYGFPKPMAVAPLKSVGNFVVCGIPLLLRPLSIGQLTRARLASPVVRLAANSAWQIGGATLWRPKRSLAGKSGIRVLDESAFDESFDDFWRRVADKYDIILTRGSAFLNWRFCNLSFRSYRILSARVNEQVVGYVVLRCMDIEGVRTGLIVDFLVERSARGEEGGLLLLQEATGVLREEGMAVASCLMLSHTQEYSLLRQAGYIVCPPRLAPQAYRLVAKALSQRVPNEFLARPDRWFVTLGNHDAV